jgi:hypothetical protein
MGVLAQVIDEISESISLKNLIADIKRGSNTPEVERITTLRGVVFTLPS